MTISGLSPNQFEDLLSPQESHYGVREITLFFRRIIHFLTHCEWVDDSVLVKKFNAYVKDGGEIDFKIQHLFQQIVIRARRTEEISNIIDEILKDKSGKNFLTSRFTLEMWCFARVNSSDSLNEAMIEENLQNLTDDQKNEFLQFIEYFKSDRSDLVRFKLADWMMKIEKEENGFFQTFLKDTITGIATGRISSQDLKINVRYIRQYLVIRGYMGFNQNVDEKGYNHTVFRPLLEHIDPEYRSPLLGSSYDLLIKDGKLGVKSFKNGVETFNWLSGFTLNEEGHHTAAYVFDGSHYVCLDNLKLDYDLPAFYQDAKNIINGNLVKLGTYRKLTAEEVLNSLEKLKMDDMHLISEDIKQVQFPNPHAWNVPAWERNNCFLVGPLLIIALHHFYKEQGIDIVKNQSFSPFPIELWGCVERGLRKIPQEIIDKTLLVLREHEKNQFLEIVKKHNSGNRAQMIEAREELTGFLIRNDSQSVYFRVHLRKLYIDLQLGNVSAEELKLKIREIREYLMNHSEYNAEVGEDKPGNAQLAYFALNRLYGRDYISICPKYEDLNVKNGRLYTLDAVKNKPHFISTLSLNLDNHQTTYVYDGENYVCIDNGAKSNLSAEEVRNIILDRSLNIPDQIFHLIPEEQIPEKFPDIRNWVIPSPERNNCYLVSAFLMVMIETYYSNLEYNKKRTIPKT